MVSAIPIECKPFSNRSIWLINWILTRTTCPGLSRYQSHGNNGEARDFLGLWNWNITPECSLVFLSNTNYQNSIIWTSLLGGSYHSLGWQCIRHILHLGNRPCRGIDFIYTLLTELIRYSCNSRAHFNSAVLCSTILEIKCKNQLLAINQNTYRVLVFFFSNAWFYHLHGTKYRSL